MGQGGFWDDVAEDLGLAYPKDIKKAMSNIYQK
jgi:hypothetical protein